jgi:anti-anti-sigma factor
MDITSEQLGERTVVRLAGRLDGRWADHLSSELDSRLRLGQHHITLDMAATVFLSSVGIRVLMNFYKKFKALEGSLAIQNPSPQVGDILQLAGLLKFFAPAASADAAATRSRNAGRQHASESTRFEIFDLEGGGMVCRAQGDPARLDGCQFTADDCQRLSLPSSTLALGLGALGGSFDECRNDFGEFMALGGSAVCLPGNGSTQCDFLVAEGGYVPEIQSLYSLACDGQFGHLVRFEAIDAQRPTGLTELTQAALALVDAPAACIAIAAESGGLIGAALRRSPAVGAQSDAPWGFPAMRQWLSFSTERLDAGSMVIAAGVVAHQARSPHVLAPFLRPVGVAGSPLGHVHAVPFRYKPLPEGLIELQRAIKPFIDSESAKTVLHLLCDDRDAQAPEESRFIRGALWVAPLNFGAPPP